MPGLEDRFDPPAQFAGASDQLHQLVKETTGCSDFGEPDYLEGLKILLLSLDYDPHLSERGRRMVWGECYSALAARAQAIQSMKDHPYHKTVEISAPVVITGIPRTGTTALHKLLAVDPQFQGLQGWLIASPQPRPPRERWAAMPAFQNAVERMQARMAAKPDLKVAHNMAADEVDECVGVLRQSFVSNVWCCAWSGASYDAWWQCQSEAPGYRYFKKVLQLIACNEPDTRWLLKNPGHIDNLDLLFETFPDAKVIHTHRDPAKAVPSLCSLLYKNHAVMEEGRDQHRAQLLGQRESAKWANALRKAEAVKARYPDQVLDVMHADFHADPMACVEQIYRWLGLELAAETRAAMMQRVEDKPELAHGVHHYQASDFGLDRASIHRQFGEYMQRYANGGE